MDLISKPILRFLYYCKYENILFHDYIWWKDLHFNHHLLSYCTILYFLHIYTQYTQYILCCLSLYQPILIIHHIMKCRHLLTSYNTIPWQHVQSVSISSFAFSRSWIKTLFKSIYPRDLICICYRDMLIAKTSSRYLCII